MIVGAWGAGLYQNDTAADVQGLIKAILRLPLPIEELVEIMQTEAVGDDSDMALTFALVIADQFEKAGIHHSAITARAIAILETQADLVELRDLGMDDVDLKARAKSNAKLLDRLRKPRDEKPRKAMKSPQVCVVAPGDILRMPIQDGCSRNPYMPVGKETFHANGWGLAQVHDVGHEFGFLNWISVYNLTWPPKRLFGRKSTHPPSLEDAVRAKPSGPLRYGTLSKSHFAKMQIEILGQGPSRVDAPDSTPNAHNARSVTVSDVSISNAFRFHAD